MLKPTQREEGNAGHGGPVIMTVNPPPAENAGFGSSEEWGEFPQLKRKKTGGRRKGTRNKKTVERAKLFDQLKIRGKDPVSFFADILRNETAPLELRFAAAKELAPFMHPKLASVEARTGGMTHEDRLEMLLKMRDEMGETD